MPFKHRVAGSSPARLTKIIHFHINQLTTPLGSCASSGYGTQRTHLWAHQSKSVHQRKRNNRPATTELKGFSGARGGNRTRTPVAGKRILSPLCLPVPPPGLKAQALLKLRYHSCAS